MFRIHTRRKGGLIQCVPVLMLLCVCASSMVVGAEGGWPKCFANKSGSQKRHLRVNGDLNITLETSSRFTHQLATHIYRILLEEELGYVRVKIVEEDDYDVESITGRLNCYDSQGNGSVIKKKIPSSMINLEVPVVSDFAISPWDMSCYMELGTIAPPGYFGWFIPKQLARALGGYDSNWDFDSLDVHWSKFTSPKFVRSLDVGDDESSRKLIDRNTYTERMGVKQYYCRDKRCSNGWYIPDNCRNNPCAVLLAPDFNSTSAVIEHIDNMKAYVKVAWLGPNLESVSAQLHDVYAKQAKRRAFMILSWTPSDVVFDPLQYVVVTMKRCDFYNGTASDGCFYTKRRSVKMAWKEIQKDVPAFELLRMMSFMEDDDFVKLLAMYRAGRGTRSVAEMACTWVNANQDVWREWLTETKNVVYIGGIFPISGSAYTGRGIVKGAMMAERAVNERRVLGNYKLQILVADGQCRTDKVMKAFIDYITGTIYNSLAGVLGPACSDTVEPLAGLSKYFKTITISYSAEGSVFSDRDKYPYFLRTIGENTHYGWVYLELLKALKWKRVAALTEDGQKYTEYISHMQNMLEANDVTFIANAKFPRTRDKDMTKHLEQLKEKRARIIIADVFDEIARNVMCEAYKLGMTLKQGYVWFLPTWLNNTWYDTTYFNHYQNESVNCTTGEMMEAINGYFAITHAYFDDDDKIMQENRTVAEWKQSYREESRGVMSNYAGYAYDAVWAYAYSLRKLMDKDPEAMYDLHSTNVTNNLTEILKQSDFHGVSGHIKFHGGTTRFSTINVLQWYKNESRVIGRFYPNVSDDDPRIHGGRLDLNKSAIEWPDNRPPDDGTPPPEECTLNALAKFLNVNCKMAIIILNLFIIVVLVVLLLSVIIVIKKRYDRKVMNTEQYMKSLGLRHLLDGVDYNGLDKWEIERESVVLNRKLGEGAFGTVYGGEANLPDTGWTPVAVKTLKIGSTTEEKLDFLSEAEVMKRFDHKNIVKLLGVCTRVEPVYTIMEFMLYGDLKTYLLARRHLVNGSMVDESEEVSSKKLTSMALDVARGLSYLAELKYVHRDVASRNCLLNGQRVVKLGDFGMTRPTFENDYYKFNRRGMLPVRWMAPESLVLGVFSSASDVWSYGVLLYEIITFGSFPFQGRTNSEVLDYVKAGNTITIPQGVKAPLECLLKTCWNSDPKKRPTARELVEYLANNSRLISPCLDVPLASVQMDDTGQLEMQLPDQFRKCSSSLSFKNLSMAATTTMPNGVSSMSIHSPTRRQQSMPDGGGIPMENCCPKEPLLPPRSDSLSGCSGGGGGKYVTIQHLPDDVDSLVADDDDDDDYFPNSIINGHAISKV